MAKQKSTQIRPMESYLEMIDTGLLSRSTTVVSNMTGNARFPLPPVDLKDLRASNDTFSALIAESLDGSKKVIARKNSQRELIITNLRLLGRYVESVANGDMATFTSSGFEPVTTLRTAQPPLSPNIRSINHGTNSGQMVIRLKAIPDALSYELHYAPTVGGVPGTWTAQLITQTKTPLILDGLTPGTIYAFQVRHMDRSGYADWSDSVTLMCI